MNLSSLKMSVIGCAMAALAVSAQDAAPSFDTPSYIEFSSARFEVRESETNAVITVVRSGDYRKVASVDYSTQEGTAQGNVNFQPSGGTITFAAGESFKMITVPILRDNPTATLKTFQVQLQDPAPNTVVITTSADVEIKPDPPMLAIKPGAGSIEVSWPDVGVPYVLDIQTDGNWSEATGKTVISGGYIFLKVKTDAPMALFRLRLTAASL
jgi:hypothetical protein